MSGLRVASVCLRTVVAALCVAPVLAAGASLEKVKAALDAYETNVTAQNEETMTLRVAQIETVIELSEERAAALHVLQEKALAEALAAWRKRAEKALSDKSITDQQLAQGASVDPEAEDAPELQPSWKEGLGKVLTAEDLKRLEARKIERKARRTRNLAELFLLFVDEKLALSTQQRERLLPIAEKLVPKVQQMIPEEVEQDEDLFNPALLLSAGKEAPEKQVRAILVGTQWERWKKVCVAPNEQEGQGANMEIPGLIQGLPPGAVEEAPAAKPVPPGARESVAQTVSKFMAAQAGRQRQRLLAPLQLQIEEAARVANLSPEVCARLQTAARGSAEKSLQRWAPQFQQFIQNNLQEATAENLSQQLARLGNPVVFQPPASDPKKPGIFEKSLNAELTAEQMATWQEELKARQAFRSHAIIRSILTTFDRLVPLQDAQIAKLDSMLTALLAEYRPEMENGTSPEQAWYLQSDVRVAPLAGLNPAEMEALLGKSRWERWTKTEEYSDAKSCWNNIKEMRQNRRR